MTFPEPLNLNPSEVTAPLHLEPNDNTDNTGGADNGKCKCGHATTDHHPFSGPDTSQQAWQCVYCGCTRAYPAPVPTP